MKKNKINIGVIGCASIAESLIIPNILKSNDFELYAVASRKKEKAIRFSSKFKCKVFDTYDELIKSDNIDAVYIPLPIGLHFEWVIKSLEMGKHVLCEKSLASSSAEVSLMLEAAIKNNRVLFENFMFPYHDQFSYVNSKIDEGFIGDLRLFKSTFCFPIFDPKKNIRYKKSLAGGALLDAGAYTILAAQMFMGSDLEISSSSLIMKDEIDFHGTAILKNQNSIYGNIYFGFDNFYQNSIELYGTKGSIVLKRAFTPKEDFSPIVILEDSTSKDEIVISPCNQAMLMLNDFYRVVQSNVFDEYHKTMKKQSYLLSKLANNG